MANEPVKQRMCFYCANTHNFTKEKCECACHPVEATFDALRAIDPEVDWTIPQLYAVKKLLEQANG